MPLKGYKIISGSQVLEFTGSIACLVRFYRIAECGFFDIEQMLQITGCGVKRSARMQLSDDPDGVCVRQHLTRTLYFLAGGLCILLGLIGVILPLLPTTPFILLAAFCFSRSSERLHQYLLNHRLFGQIIRDWEDYGVIPLKAKIIGTSMMLVMVSYPLIFRDFHIGLKALAGATVLFAIWYVWSRPSVPGKRKKAELETLG